MLADGSGNDFLAGDSWEFKDTATCAVDTAVFFGNRADYDIEVREIFDLRPKVASAVPLRLTFYLGGEAETDHS